MGVDVPPIGDIHYEGHLETVSRMHLVEGDHPLHLEIYAVSPLPVCKQRDKERYDPTREKPLK